MGFKDWDPEAVEEALNMDLTYESSPDVPNTATRANRAIEDAPLHGAGAVTDSKTFRTRAAIAEDLAKRKLREHVASAADSLIFLSLHSADEAIRMRASQYILDRVLGKSDNNTIHKGTDAPIERMLEGVIEPN